MKTVDHRDDFEAAVDRGGWTDFVNRSESIGVVSGATDDFGFGAGPPPLIPPGTDLGEITIGRFLGAGGMGCVYEARQHRPERRVAVKLMREGAVTPAQFKRFHYEAELLGRLEHPGIATVHFVGRAQIGPLGVPFIVMELVDDARPVTQFCSEQEQGVHGRLRMMRQVAAAIAYAHRKGVIHRDLKPGNILVDPTGLPKVIDFGVARSMADDAPARTMLTEAGHVMGTLHYMSPEQLSGRSIDVDARSDVHALGLVLFELLVGRLPYDVRGRSPLDAARIVAETEPSIVKAVMSALRADRNISRDDARSVAAIVAKCLEKRPEDRYPTAADVEAEIGRWLEGESVLARPPGLCRAVLRLARRHRLAAAAAALVLTTLVVSLGVISRFAMRSERAAAMAQAQLYRATVLLAANARDRGAVGEAVRLTDSARGLAATDRPALELNCLAASLDESVANVPCHGGLVRAVAWSPSGAEVAAATDHGTICLWPVATAAGMAAAAPTVFVGHEKPVWAVAWSPNGRLLASAAEDGTARIWHHATQAERQRLEGHAGTVYSVAFSPDGTRLATAGRDGTARIWNVETSVEERVLDAHAGTVYGVCFSPDGRLLATACKDGGVRLWDVASGGLAGRLSGHDARAFSVTFSPNGELVAAAAEDGAVRIWEVEARRERAVLPHPYKANAAVFVADGEQLVTVADDCLVRWWDVGRATPLASRRGHHGAVWSIGMSADGAWLATGSADATVRLWSASDASDPIVECGGKVSCIAMMPDGAGCVVGTERGAAVVSLPALQLEPRWLLDGLPVNDLHVMGTSHKLIAACEDGMVVIGDIPSRDTSGSDPPCQRLTLHARRVRSVEVDAGGEQLATASEDGTAKIWDLRSVGGEPAPRQVFKHGRRVLCARFLPDGAAVVTGCEDRIARRWDVASGRITREYAGHAGPINWLAVSGDGRLLATASSDTTVRLWDAASGASMATLRGPARQVRKVVFTPDEKRVVAVGDDGVAHVWDVASGEAVSVLRGHVEEARAVAILPDGTAALTGGWDGTVRAWGLSAAAVARGRYERAKTWPSVSWSTPALRLSPCISLGQSSTSTIFSAPLRPTTVGTEIATSRRP